MVRFLIISLASILLISCNNKFNKVLKSKDFDYKYNMAEQYYKEKKYDKAQILFEELFPYVKGSARYEDMYYKFAYSYYYEKEYPNAENLFKTFVEQFPNSAKAEECDYMRAYCFYKQSPKVELDQTNTQRAAALMQAFINTHPTSTRVKEAYQIIESCREKLELKEFRGAELYYNLGFFKAAAIAFTSIYENYPDSKKADEYKLLAIRSYFRYAQMSYEEKQAERFEKVLNECNEFSDRFSDSKFLDEVNKIKANSNQFFKKDKK